MPEAVEAPPTSVPLGPPPSSFPSSVPLGPVGERDRILALDVLRGFALLGIFFVNLPFFAGPFANLFGPIGGDEATRAEFLAWGFIKVFCEFKFISLFSLLFGMGLVVQITRARAAGRPFVAMYLRRLVILAGFGLAHVVFLWYGDILFFYAGCGAVLLLLSLFGARGLLIAAFTIFMLTGLLVIGFSSLSVGMLKHADTQAAIDAVAAEEAAVEETAVNRTAADGEAVEGDGVIAGSADAVTVETVVDAPLVIAPTAGSDSDADAPLDKEQLRREPFKTVLGSMFTDPTFLFGDRFAEIERVAYGEGPYATGMAVRFSTWSFIALQVAFSLAWRIIAMFAAGAALMKLDFFAPRCRHWHRRMCAIGLLVGLPLEILAFVIASQSDFGVSWGWVAGEAIHYFGSMVLCLGYVGAVVLLVQRDVRQKVVSVLAGAFATVGRMALTNYILQSVITTYVMYSWGQGRFDTFGRPQMLAFTAVVFTAQIILSVLWLRVFRTGPLEYIWRTLTYMRPPALLRDRTEESPR